MPCYVTTAVLNGCYSEGTAYTALDRSYWVVSTTRMDDYVTPTIDINHDCHIKAIELI